MHAKEAQATIAHIPVIQPAQLMEADAIIFGTPTRYGNVCGQMQQFMDATGQLWFKGALIGKVGSVFTSTGSQHGGQETTIRSFHTELLHHGMVIVGVPLFRSGPRRDRPGIGRDPLRRLDDGRSRRLAPTNRA